MTLRTGSFFLTDTIDEAHELAIKQQFDLDHPAPLLDYSDLYPVDPEDNED